MKTVLQPRGGIQKEDNHAKGWNDERAGARRAAEGERGNNAGGWVALPFSRRKKLFTVSKGLVADHGRTVKSSYRLDSK